MQAEGLGEARPVDAPPARGDLVFFQGHVAIALDDWRILHATWTRAEQSRPGLVLPPQR